VQKKTSNPTARSTYQHGVLDGPNWGDKLLPHAKRRSNMPTVIPSSRRRERECGHVGTSQGRLPQGAVRFLQEGAGQLLPGPPHHHLGHARPQRYPQTPPSVLRTLVKEALTSAHTAPPRMAVQYSNLI